MCALVIDHPFVSSQHAVIRWTGERWEIRDLGSRNGTRINGQPIVGPDPRWLDRGALIAFGHDQVAWELADDSPAEILLVPIAGGDAIVVEDQLIALPSDLDPEVTIYRAEDGAWYLERADAPAAALAHGDRFEAAGRTWRFCCPTALIRTSSTVEAQCRSLCLHLFVSKDEEHVELKAQLASSSIDLGASARNYLLLTLARLRHEDRARGLAETSCGWVYQEDLIERLRVSLQQLNVDVFRVRQQFAQKGLPASSSIIERRPRTHQIRIGVEHFEIHPL